MTHPALGRAIRRLADQQSAKATAPPPDRSIVATVTTVLSGAAKDGNAIVKVTWRGNELTAAGWNISQTFAVGQRVVCEIIDAKLYVNYPVGGHP